MIIDMIFRFFSYTKQEKRLREQRRLVPSRPFSTSLRRPLLFRLAGKEGGEKGRLDAFGAHCGYGLGKSLFLGITNTHTHLTSAMVRAACYGTSDLQVAAFEWLL